MLTCSEAESAGLSSFLGRAMMMVGCNARASTGRFDGESDSSGKRWGGFGDGLGRERGMAGL